MTNNSTLLQNGLKKMLKNCTVIFTFFFLIIFQVQSQTVNPDLLKHRWKASWISGNNTSLKAYGVYLYRKSVSIAEQPKTFIIHISADNRYKLYINETLVSLGPAVADLYHWKFETVDVAKYLHKGINIVTALVWNEGEYKPERQMSFKTSFLLQGNSAEEKALNTDTSWKVKKSDAYHPLEQINILNYAAGAGELIDMNFFDMNWLSLNFDDSNWPAAKLTGWERPTPKGLPQYGGSERMLVPDLLPAMEMKTLRLAAVRRSEGVQIPSSFPAVKTAFTIPPNSNAVLLLDQNFLTNAYPTLIFSNGKNAMITIGYAEALFEKMPTGFNESPKGNRNEIEGKIFAGRKDSIISNGAALQNFTSLNWRTYRYIEIKINTKEYPLTIDDFFGTTSMYPFALESKFDANDEKLNQIYQIGWRTARLCAMETYMDCPFYEQLQYSGDTRVQAMVTLFSTTDDRLIENALTQFDYSRNYEGITSSRYPTVTLQQIPTFSLWYIGMLYDFWMYRPKADFVKDKINGVRQVLHFFEKYQQKDGSLANVPYWLFTDWVHNKKDWIFGAAPINKNGESALLDFQLLWAYQLAAEMEKYLGTNDFFKLYTNRANQLKQTIQKKYWVPQKGLYADRAEKDVFSQHSNTLAILCGLVEGNIATAVAKKILNDSTLAPASIYFKYYMHQALTKAGLGDDYLNWLGIWQKNIDLGLTTWAETSEVESSRSDCHGWGSHPNIEFFRTVLGVSSDAPGFKKIRIEPHLGKLKKVKGEMPHPDGMISVTYDQQGSKFDIEINIPEKATGFFIWKKKNYQLKGGKNKFFL